MSLEADLARIIEQGMRKALEGHVCCCAPSGASGPRTRSRSTGAPPRTGYTVAEVAASLSVPYKTALRLVREKRLRAIWTGHAYVVPVAALDEYLATSD
ncbi:helix-turn-helix domain-containing protein [Pseudonocardia dioxanivorans]|jgi:excisionase family DNA binding protein|uniref:helix-turn-helix domain-containing protein n=1 Tax=Pseudonocardia dioxanivorans TaxID=240495 RepID=UPI000CCFD914|nr:helix-turn-helix domain-containing protein [Pseudonocardia dioxanivorans]